MALKLALHQALLKQQQMMTVNFAGVVATTMTWMVLQTVMVIVMISTLQFILVLLKSVAMMLMKIVMV